MQGSARGGLVVRLFEEFYERVYWFARRSVDASSAEDVAQEVFVRLLRIPDLDQRVVSVSYLIKVADNLMKRRHKQRVQHDRFTTEQHACAGACAGEAPDAHVDDEDQSFDGLTNSEHAALRLIVCEGLSYENAARALSVNVSTVNNWKFRGIKKLRDTSDLPLESLAG